MHIRKFRFKITTHDGDDVLDGMLDDIFADVAEPGGEVMEPSPPDDAADAAMAEAAADQASRLTKELQHLASCHLRIERTVFRQVAKFGGCFDAVFDDI